MKTDNQEKPIAQMQDLLIEMNDGLIRLQQSDGMDDYSIIDLHPIQIRLLAEHAGLLAAPSIPLNVLSASHVRRINALFERIKELYFADDLNEEIIKYCGSGFEIASHLRAIYEQADDLIADIADNETTRDSVKGASHDIKPEQCNVKPAEQLVLT